MACADAAPSAIPLGSTPQAVVEENGASPEVEESEDDQEEPGSRSNVSDQGLDKPPEQTAEEVEKVCFLQFAETAVPSDGRPVMTAIWPALLLHVCGIHCTRNGS